MEHTLRMNAYYYGFRPTGEIKIDQILSRVAEAGKAYHHTSGWTDPMIDDASRSYVDLIQEAADEAARELATQRAALIEQEKKYLDEHEPSIVNKLK